MAFDLGSAVGYLDLDTTKFKRGLQLALSELNVLQDTAATTSQKWTAFGKSLSSVGGVLTKSVTLPLIGIGTAATAVGNSFEAQMDRVQGTLGATEAEMEALRDQAIQLGADTAFSASEAAEGMENLASAGFTAEEIMAAMPGLLDLAAASGASLADASSYAATTLNAFQLEASDAAHVADVYALAAARTNAQTEDMGEAMKYIAPVAQAMGQSLESTAAAIGIMSDAGIVGGQAGTTLRAALSRMAKPTDVMTEKMDQLGITFYDAEGNMKSYSQIITDLQASFVGLTQEEQNNALVTLFGQEALSGMQALIQAGPEQLDELTAALENSDGASQDMADTMMGNTKGAIEQMMGAFESAAIVLQEKLAPYIIQVANTIGDLATKFSQLDDSTLETIVTVGGIVAAIGPLLLIVGKVIAGISSLITAFSTISSAATALAPIGTALSGFAAPIAAVIAAIVGLKVAWDTNFGGMRDTLTSFWNEVTATLSPIISTVQSIFTQFLTTIVSMWNSNWMNVRTILESAWNAIETVFGSAITIITNILGLFLNVFTGDWEGALDNIKNIFQAAWDAICSVFQFALDAILNLFIVIIPSLISSAGEAMASIKDAFSKKWEDIKSWWSNAVQDPVTTIKGIKDALFNAGKELFTSLWNGLKSVWSSITSWVGEAVDWIKNRVAFWQGEAEKVNSGSTRSSSSVQGSFASGIDYVPRDMDARIHEGERILTKEENKEFSSNNRQSGNTFIFNSPEAIDAVTAAREFRKTSRRLAEGLI